MSAHAYFGHPGPTGGFRLVARLGAKEEWP